MIVFGILLLKERHNRCHHEHNNKSVRAWRSNKRRRSRKITTTKCPKESTTIAWWMAFFYTCTVTMMRVDADSFESGARMIAMKNYLFDWKLMIPICKHGRCEDEKDDEDYCWAHSNFCHRWWSIDRTTDRILMNAAYLYTQINNTTISNNLFYFNISVFLKIFYDC